MNLERYVVMTSIFAPTEAVHKFAALPGTRLVVAGDRKSPPGWQCENVAYLSAESQEALPYRLGHSLPWNHYCRKMLGYLHAMSLGASVIVDTDDDNIPKANWAMPDFAGGFETSAPGLGFVNIYKSFTAQHIWPRGFPLERVTNDAARLAPDALTRQDVQVGIWQGLADGDPDVDAIYRLTSNTPCLFEERAPIVLASGTVCPFNSQNTAFRRELFALLYLPAFVTFRFTDILRGLVAQPILWAAGYALGFTDATVFQERNPHNYLRDFESEIPCYLYPEKIMAVVGAAVRPAQSVADNLQSAYEALRREGIVEDRELALLADWLGDVQQMGA